MKASLKYLLIIPFTGMLGAYTLGQSLPNPPVRSSSYVLSSHNQKGRVVEKPPVDSAAIVTWPELDHTTISNDGRYYMYRVQNIPVGGQTLVLEDTAQTWRKELPGISNGSFSGDSKKFIFQVNDTIHILGLGSGKDDHITTANSFQLISSGADEWLAYQVNSLEKELVLREQNDRVRRFPSVAAYSFSNDGKVLLLRTEVKQGTTGGQLLQWVDMPEGNPHTIWSSADFADKQTTITSTALDATGRQLVFLVEEKKDGRTLNTIWYYSKGMDKAQVKAGNNVAGINPDLTISNESPRFSNNGRYIFFRLKAPTDNRKPAPDAVMVDVWSYKDSVLQFEQAKQPDQLSFVATLDINTDQVMRLEKKDERFLFEKGDYGIVLDKMSILAYWWPSFGQKSCWLVSLKDGSRRKINTGVNGNCDFSPNERYLVYYDARQGHYFSYDLGSGKTKNISKEIPPRWLVYDEPRVLLSTNPNLPLGFAGWVGEGRSMLVYDQYDIWQLDLEGRKEPVNITNGYGRKNKIKLRLVYGSETTGGFSGKTKLLITAFNTVNKYNGFYSAVPGKAVDPELLSMGPWTLYHSGPGVLPRGGEFTRNMRPLKAQNADVWIVKRETGSVAPNYFLTSNFKQYKALTNLQPQEKYNWLTTELVTWKQLDGTTSQGVLYRPENFDSTNKYPVIFQYYEQFSQRLYEFPIPNFSAGRIDIPWYVSRGYLVFTPDIHYSIANESGKVIGDHAVNSLVSAAQHLARLPYVDAKKMGIQGHSYAGGETLYLITHSNLFAAACAAAATVSNEISAYLGILRKNGKPILSKMEHSEIGHNKIGTTLWQRPDLYIKASPVFRADKVTTPLLIMHNQGDEVCDWDQSVQMYMALRRLGKKVWMLQYDKGHHGVRHKEEAIDFTIRMNQFFDHYLKNATPPKWLTQGIPARLKGIETGFGGDDSSNQP